MTLIFLPGASGSSCIISNWLVTQSNVGFQKVTLPAGRKAYSQGKRGGKRALQAVQFRDSGCVKSFYFLYSNALTSWGLAGLGDTAFPWVS